MGSQTAKLSKKEKKALQSKLEKLSKKFSKRIKARKAAKKALAIQLAKCKKQQKPFWDELKASDKKVKKLRKKLAALKLKLNPPKPKKKKKKSKASAITEVAIPTPTVEQKEVIIEVQSPDDLKKIEGIGPKISELLQAAGIHTFKALSKSNVADLKQILVDAGPRFGFHQPTTWPEQAALAAKNKWEELKTLQAELKGGRR